MSGTKQKRTKLQKGNYDFNRKNTNKWQMFQQIQL